MSYHHFSEQERYVISLLVENSGDTILNYLGILGTYMVRPALQGKSLIGKLRKVAYI